MKKKIVVTTLILTVFLSSIWGQKRPASDLRGVIYDHEKAADLRIHTHGWAANVQFGKLKTYYKTQYYSIGLGELKHFKETKTSTDFIASSPGTSFRQYTYGKQNYAYTLRGGWGMKRYYSEKAEKKGVALGVSYGGGISTAMMVPYYVEVSVNTGGTNKETKPLTIKYSPETASQFLDRYKVRGKGGFLKGIQETSVIPGIYGQAGVHLDWGAFDEFLRAVEVGVMLDVYPKKLPIMVTEDNKPYFLNFYLSVQVGKRN